MSAKVTPSSEEAARTQEAAGSTEIAGDPTPLSPKSALGQYEKALAMQKNDLDDILKDLDDLMDATGNNSKAAPRASGRPFIPGIIMSSNDPNSKQPKKNRRLSVGQEPFRLAPLPNRYAPNRDAPPPTRDRTSQRKSPLENLEERKDEMSPNSRDTVEAITENVKDISQNEVDELMSPRSRNAARALQQFKSASGLRKATEAIVEYINNEPEDMKSFAHYRWRMASFTESLPCRAFFISLVCINSILMWVQVTNVVTDRCQMLHMCILA